MNSPGPSAPASTRPRLGPQELRRRVRQIGRRTGVRTRSVLVAVTVVFVALMVGVSALLYTLEIDLQQTAEARARARASEIVAQLSTDGLAATERAIGDSTHTTSIVQVLDSSGSVLQATTQDVADHPMSAQRPAVGDYDSTDVDLDIRHGAGGEWKVVTTAVELGEGTYYVQAAVPISEQRDTIQTVGLFLLAGTPLLLGAVAVAVWMLVGRALRSVESIRRSVADIGAHRLAQRVDVPPTRDEVAALAVTMNSMLDRLQTADRVQRAFVSDASHELRSPLATLTTAGELAVSASPDRQSELLASMNIEIARLRGLVENLMILARADAQDLAIRHTEVDLDDLVAAEARRLRLTDDVEVLVDIVPARVSADEQRLAQALRNLVDNAARHAATTIRLTLRCLGPDAVVWVDDDGPGVPVQDRDRVFERFVRLDEARARDDGGSGLGLAIARATLQAHGGSVAVVDGPPGWCRFELSIPLDPGHHTATPAPAGPADPAA